MASHSSILAWRIPWIEGPGGLQFTGSQRFRHDESDLARVFLEYAPHLGSGSAVAILTCMTTYDEQPLHFRLLP